MPSSVLNDEQIEQFLTRGHVVINDCFSRDLAKTYTDRAWTRLGYDPNDISTWEQEQIHMPRMETWEVKDFSPKAWSAICELMGGEDRVLQPTIWGDSYILNLRRGADRPWQPPSPETPGWHKDGDWFVHFLDSPEQGLLVVVIWSDIKPKSGGTFIIGDSVPVVARFLKEHPEGVMPGGFPFRQFAAECNDFIELTGNAGDIVLLHPYMLHASSQNPSGVPRFMTNPAISFKEPMQFNRENPDDFSIVERTILRSLGVDCLDFQITGKRERVVPERVRKQQEMLEQEKARLASV